jgi:hypothetical protein
MSCELVSAAGMAYDVFRTNKRAAGVFACRKTVMKGEDERSHTVVESILALH